jgi:Bacterial Ig-like domain (group 2)
MKTAILFLCCVISAVANAQFGGSSVSMIVRGPSGIKAAQSLTVGGTYQFTATCKFTNNGVVTVSACPALTWKSTSNTDATISSTGLVSAQTPGTVSFTASSGSITSNSVTFSVVAASKPTLTSITLTAGATLPLGRTEYLSPTCHFSDGTTKACAISTWNELAAVTGSNSLGWSISLNAYGMLTGVNAHGKDQFSVTQGTITSNVVTVAVP